MIALCSEEDDANAPHAFAPLFTENGPYDSRRGEFARSTAAYNKPAYPPGLRITAACGGFILCQQSIGINMLPNSLNRCIICLMADPVSLSSFLSFLARENLTLPLPFCLAEKEKKEC